MTDEKLKIDKRHHYIVVLDIETANIINDALAYDIGFQICDTVGNVYQKRSYMISEMFFDNKELMDSAYYKEKLPQYWEEWKQGKREIASIYKIRKELSTLMKLYNAYEVYAYNGRFDKSGCNRTFRYLTKSKFRYFFPPQTKFYCIWHMACQTIFQEKKFFKMAMLNEWISDKGNVKTSAEIGQRYISGDINFEEQHTGLEDTEIEYQILLKCLKSTKKIDRSLKPNCWQLPQKKFKNFIKRVDKTANI